MTPGSQTGGGLFSEIGPVLLLEQESAAALGTGGGRQGQAGASRGRQGQASDLHNRGVFPGLLHPGLRPDMEQPFPTEPASVSTVMDHSLGGFSRLNSLLVLPHRILMATDK